MKREVMAVAYSGALELTVVETSQASEARRLAVQAAKRLDFDETATGRVAIIISELASNLVKHAAGGKVLVRPLEDHGRTGLEILAIDKGPGMADLAASLRDGTSTAGTSGTGLGAIQRLSDHFGVYTRPHGGVLILSRIWPQAPLNRRPGELQIGGVSLRKAGEDVCGDGWAALPLEKGCLIAVVDGVGHGLPAHEAAEAAIRISRENRAVEPDRLLYLAHAALRSTRGAAMAAARIDLRAGRLTFAGIGNISARVVSPSGSQHLVSLNGTVGHSMRQVRPFTYNWPPSALLLLHSDGLTSHWDLDDYSGLSERDPTLVAGVLCRDHRRMHDDVTVVVAKQSDGRGGPRQT
jgi:anti-sigma regulatory factor (Ser/Thr protein kinase)